MSKILKNTTASPVTITDVGQTVPASGQLTIDPNDYWLYAASSDAITLIGNGTLIVNDGSSDLSIASGSKLIQGIFPNPIRLQGATNLTQIGNIGDALKVFPASVSAAGFTTFKSSTEVVLTSDTTYTTLHSASGSGHLMGATFVVDNNEAECSILVDGNEVFNFSGAFLSEVVNKDSSFRASGIFGVTNDGKRLYFTPSQPIRFTSSLTFRARRNGKKVKYQLYTYSLE